ncbi:hypothetical protein Rhopal_004760-T1 [Rhodotorula paludigena]|uniref:Proteophosphoglycan ppg4 n=1 Tax=Rhodotorula paludigena TaxID=86838 RepID=A0AAV5GQT9_9BASI|nr:hypothetical protein Rhopal_004760-T1 [Rhodotorula paludigena]
MDESTEGLSLPTFSGRLSADWSSHEQRLRSWLAVRGIPLHAHEAAETLSLSLVSTAAAAWEHEAGDVERRVFDEAVRWCRARWDGQDRRRWAATAAVNELNSRSFRGRGRRREGIKDLLNDLELLFLQAGVVDDEAQRRVFVGCFFEFPHCLSRLSRTTSFGAAVDEALRWEADMVRKERAALTTHLEVPATSPSHRTAQADSLTTPTAEQTVVSDVGENAGNDSTVSSRFVEQIPSPAEELPPLATLYRAAYPSRSTETLAIRSIDEAQPRAQTALAAYPSPPQEPLQTRRSQRARSKLPEAFRHSVASDSAVLCAPAPPHASNGPARGSLTLSIPHSHHPSSSRTPTPPFVSEATSFRSSDPSSIAAHRISHITSSSSAAPSDLYGSFPYPARPSPTTDAFRTLAAPLERRSASAATSGADQPAQWRSSSPLARSYAQGETHGAKDGPGWRKSPSRTTNKLAALLRRPFVSSASVSSSSGRGHRKSHSLSGALEVPALVRGGGAREGEEGRPAKMRGMAAHGGLGLPP